MWFIKDTGSGQKLPPGFPDVSVYTGAKLVSANKKTTEKGDSYQGIWHSNNSVLAITDWYIKTIKNSGWTIEILPANAPGSTISYLVAKKSDTVLQLSIVSQPGTLTEITADFPVDYGTVSNN